MLLIDGIRYELWTPPNEDSFEQVVKEHAQEIFGDQSIYLDRKQKLKSLSGIGSIPDGYVIVPSSSPQWHIVEVELSSHLPYEHIVPQVDKFINAVDYPNTRNEIVEALYSTLNNDELLRVKMRQAIGRDKDIHKFLADLISQPPTITIIIEKNTEQVREATKKYAQKSVVEFQTFVRVGAEAVHAHLFEPLHVAVIHTGGELEVEGEQSAGGRREKQKRVKPKLLKELVAEELLKDGQVLYFYHTRSFWDEQAQVVASENKLKYKADGKLYSIGKLYSMSKLAEILSRKYGLPAGRHDRSGRSNWGVSGPKYWKTEDGKSPYDLFKQWKVSKSNKR